MATTVVKKITPFLWYDGTAEEAAKFYTSIFKNSSITSSTPMATSFVLEGQNFVGFNAGPMFKFNEAISFFIDCEGQEEVDYFWNKFIEGGGTESQCGWLKDKWGVSWQVVPKRLMQLIGDPDREKADKAMQAMFKMKKIIVADLEAAVKG